MAIFMFMSRINTLIHQKYDIQYRLAKIAKRISDLESYSAMVGKGSISIGDLLNSPASMSQRTLMYLSGASNYANQYMQQNAPYYQQMYAQQMGQVNPQQAQQMQLWIQRMLWQQARDRYSEMETANLHAEEKKLNLEKDRLEALNSTIEQELKAAKEARDAGIKDFAPKYVAQA